MSAEPEFAKPGHNVAPADYDPIIERLNETPEYQQLRDRTSDLLAAVGRVPEVIENDETGDRVADFISKQIRPCIKNAKAYRVAEKQPYLDGGRTVDATFNAISEPLEKAIKLLTTRLTMWDRPALEPSSRAATFSSRSATTSSGWRQSPGAGRAR